MPESKPRFVTGYGLITFGQYMTAIDHSFFIMMVFKNVSTPNLESLGISSRYPIQHTLMKNSLPRNKINTDLTINPWTILAHTNADSRLSCDNRIDKGQ
jgi:hypothetical protein